MIELSCTVSDGMRVKVLIADPKAKRSTASDSPPSGMFMGNFGYSSQPMDSKLVLFFLSLA